LTHQNYIENCNKLRRLIQLFNELTHLPSPFTDNIFGYRGHRLHVFLGNSPVSDRAYTHRKTPTPVAGQTAVRETFQRGESTRLPEETPKTAAAFCSRGNTALLERANILALHA
jgi:hypothetical protein